MSERDDVEGAELIFFSGGDFNQLLKLCSNNDFASETDDIEVYNKDCSVGIFILFKILFVLG